MPFLKHPWYQKSVAFTKHHWLTLAFILGFIFDNLTLTRVDRLFDDLTLTTYVVLSMAMILLHYSAITERFKERTNIFWKTYAPFVMQYTFGGLLSGMLIFYGRSGAWQDSWLFILLMIAVVYGNEAIKDRAQQLMFNLLLFFVGLFTYATLIIPVVIGMMGPWVFVGSGCIALFLMFVFLNMIEGLVPKFMRLEKRRIVFSMMLIFVTLNVLYFTNIIPPVPLSQTSGGIYHEVIHGTDDHYTFTAEKPRWWERILRLTPVFHPNGGDVFCYASIYAPARLTTNIMHRWEYYDTSAKKWVTQTRIPYAIHGGRTSGYRGYTQISNYQEGLWRCTVETERGQVIARTKFTIETGKARPLVTVRE